MDRKCDRQALAQSSGSWGRYGSKMWKVPSKPIDRTTIREGILAIFLITGMKYLSKSAYGRKVCGLRGIQSILTEVMMVRV